MSARKAVQKRSRVVRVKMTVVYKYASAAQMFSEIGEALERLRENAQEYGAVETFDIETEP